MATTLYSSVARGEHYRKKGGRLNEEADESVLRQKPGDPAEYVPLFPAFHALDKAHLVMLAEENLIPRRDAARMLAALLEMEKQGLQEVRLATGGAMHSGEHYLIEHLGEEVGGRIHLGRSSGDMGSVGGHYTLRAAYLEVMADLLELRQAVIGLASQHAESVMPHYTRHQHGQTTTLGHYLMALAFELERDFERLEQAYHRNNQSTAGCGAGTGSDFPLNRRRTAELLGFEAVMQNTKDAYASVDYGLEAYGALAVLLANLGRVIDDLFLWYTYEFRLVDFADRYCGTSSIMAQKKNPHAIMWLQESVSQFYGKMAGAFQQVRSLSGLGALKELWTSFEDLRLMLRTLGGILTTMKVNTGRMGELAGAFWAQAADLSGAMVNEKGLPWRTAYQITAILVRQSIEAGKTPAQVTPADVDRAARQYTGEPLGLSDAVIRRALDPLSCASARTLIGGPAPQEVRRQVAAATETLVRDRSTLASLEEQVRAAEAGLNRAAEAIIASA